MNCEQLKIAFAGTPEFAAVSLDALIKSRHEVVGVLTQPDRPAGRGRKLTASAVKELAVEAGITVLQPSTLRSTEAFQSLTELNADVWVVAAYGLILPVEVLGLPVLGCLPWISAATLAGRCAHTSCGARRRCSDRGLYYANG